MVSLIMIRTRVLQSKASYISIMSQPASPGPAQACLKITEASINCRHQNAAEAKPGQFQSKRSTGAALFKQGKQLPYFY